MRTLQVKLLHQGEPIGHTALVERSPLGSALITSYAFDTAMTTSWRPDQNYRNIREPLIQDPTTLNDERANGRTTSS